MSAAKCTRHCQTPRLHVHFVSLMHPTQMNSMQINETLIRSVVAQVLAEVGRAPMVAGKSFAGRNGVFTCANEAVAAARDAFEQLSERTVEDRKRIIGHIRRISIDQCVELGTMEMNETKVGRLEHKIEKLKTLGEKTPGVEFLRSEVYSGDHGLAVIEHRRDTRQAAADSISSSTFAP